MFLITCGEHYFITNYFNITLAFLTYILYIYMYNVYMDYTIYLYIYIYIDE